MKELLNVSRKLYRKNVLRKFLSYSVKENKDVMKLDKKLNLKDSNGFYMMEMVYLYEYHAESKKLINYYV